MHSQAVPRFWMSIKETFSNSIELAVIIQSDKESAIQISTVLGHVYHERIYERWLFTQLSDYVFRVRSFEITISLKVIIFVKILKISSRFPKCTKKIDKKFFVFEIIASELVSLNCLY